MEIQANQATFRSYLFFWSGQLVSLLGSSISQFIIIWWITLETESTLFLSIASLLGFAPIVILGPLTGVLVDRWNRKALIGIVDLLQASTTVVLIFLFWLDVIAVWQVLTLLSLRGVFQAFHIPSVFAIIPTMVPKEKLRESVEEFVSILLQKSPIILKFAKMAINKALETSLSAGLAYETDLCALCFGTEDLKEGAQAFLEKRTPVFKGK